MQIIYIIDRLWCENTHEFSAILYHSSASDSVQVFQCYAPNRATCTIAYKQQLCAATHEQCHSAAAFKWNS